MKFNKLKFIRFIIIICVFLTTCFIINNIIICNNAEQQIVLYSEPKIITQEPMEIEPTPVIIEEPIIQIPEYKINLDKQSEKLIHDLCKKNDLDYETILSWLHLESRFNDKLIHKNTDNTYDFGIAQINNRYTKFYHECAVKYGELDPNITFDPLNIEHGIRAGIGGLTYYKEQWTSKGITDKNTLMLYSLNSYNMGIDGYLSYIKRTGSISRGYDRAIIDRRNELETNKELK